VSKSLIGALSALVLCLPCGAANAQVMVYDVKSYASLIKQASTALDQLKELKGQVVQAKALYEAFNTPSGIGSIASNMNAPQLRAFVPDIDLYLAASNGDLKALGEIGQRADAMRQANRLYTPSPDDSLGQELDQAGDRAARDLALGQQASIVGAQRLAGLQQLNAALEAAPNARAVMDIQARLSAEQAMISNDQMRLQGLAMAQDAETRLQIQRDRERAKAAASARLKLYQDAFQ
jgi:type IV secretion system protein VirB5